MTDIRLELQAELARLDRDRAETTKLMEETRKFVSESRKLAAEAQKLDRERWWFPTLQLLVSFATSAVIAAVIARLIH